MLNLYQKYQPHPKNISELKVALQPIWNDLSQDPIDRSILSSTKWWRACIKANDLSQDPIERSILSSTKWLRACIKANDLSQDPIDRSILSSTKWLRACIKANSEHFEYVMWLTSCNLLLWHDVLHRLSNINRLTPILHSFMLHMSEMSDYILLMLSMKLHIYAIQTHLMHEQQHTLHTRHSWCMNSNMIHCTRDTPDAWTATLLATHQHDMHDTLPWGKRLIPRHLSVALHPYSTLHLQLLVPRQTHSTAWQSTNNSGHSTGNNNNN